MNDDDKQGEFDSFADDAEIPTNFGKINPLERASYLKALREQKPSWQTDGLGIRGTADIVSNSHAKLDWPKSAISPRRYDPQLDQGTTEVAAEVPTGP